MDALSDVLKPRPAWLGVQGRKRATDLRVAHAGEPARASRRQRFHMPPAAWRKAAIGAAK